MEWQLAIAIILGGLFVLMVTGMPIAFCFMLINVVGALLWWGGEPGLRQLMLSLFDSVTKFALLPLPLFILMGETMYHSRIAPMLIDSVDKWLGRLPGRLSLLAVFSGTLFATLTGESEASVAMLGDVLVPEMETIFGCWLKRSLKSLMMALLASASDSWTEMTTTPSLLKPGSAVSMK